MKDCGNHDCEAAKVGRALKTVAVTRYESWKRGSALGNRPLEKREKKMERGAKQSERHNIRDTEILDDKTFGGKAIKPAERKGRLD